MAIPAGQKNTPGALHRALPRTPFAGKRGVGGAIWLLLPAVLFLLVFFAYPAFEILRRTFTDFNFPQSSGLDNIDWAFTTNVNLIVLQRTAITAALVTGLCVAIGYPYAYFLAVAPRHWRSVLLGVVIISTLSSLLVRSYAWVVILQRNGPLEQAFHAIGIDGVELAGQTSGVVLSLTQILVPLMILPLYAAMRRFDATLLRAAQSLGANPAMTFLKVFLPLTAPALLSGCLLVFVTTLGFYVTPTLVGSANHALVSQLIVTEISRLLAWGHAGALSLGFLVVTVLFVGFVARMFRRGQEQLVQGSRAAPLVNESKRWSGSRRMRIGMLVLVAVVSILLIAPVVVIFLLGFTGGQTFAFPPPSWSTQWFSKFFSSSAWTSALLESIKVGALSTGLATILGTAAAFGLDRSKFPGKTLISGLLIAPLIVPVVIFAVGVYAVFLRWKFVGTTFGFVMAHTALAIPLVVIPVAAALQTFDRRLETAAASLGAGRVATFWLVTLPILLPSIAAGALFAFLTSFDEVVTSLFIASPTNQTLPVAIYNALTRQIDPTAAAASTVVLLSSLMLGLAALYLRKVVRHAG